MTILRAGCGLIIFKLYLLFREGQLVCTSDLYRGVGVKTRIIRQINKEKYVLPVNQREIDERFGILGPIGTEPEDTRSWVHGKHSLIYLTREPREW